MHVVRHMPWIVMCIDEKGYTWTAGAADPVSAALADSQRLKEVAAAAAARLTEVKVVPPAPPPVSLPPAAAAPPQPSGEPQPTAASPVKAAAAVSQGKLAKRLVGTVSLHSSHSFPITIATWADSCPNKIYKPNPWFD